MMRAIVWDTSVLDVYLQVPGYLTCGPEGDQWDHRRIDELVNKRRVDGTTFVLPIAAILECGNHIAQARDCDRHGLAQKLVALVCDASDGTQPWAAIADYESVWSGGALRQLIESWPEKAAQKISLSDMTISSAADHFAKSGFAVEILTGDRGLKAQEPLSPPPRRRS